MHNRMGFEMSIGMGIFLGCVVLGLAWLLRAPECRHMDPDFKKPK